MYHSSALLINTEKCFCRYLPSGICCLFYLCANNINSSFHTFLFILFLSISQFSSVAQSCPTLCDLMDCSMPGFPVRHQLLEPVQTHVHRVGDNHPTNSSSVVPFSSCLQFFPASGSFPMSQFFISGGQSIGASASASVLPMNIQD